MIYFSDHLDRCQNHTSRYFNAQKCNHLQLGLYGRVHDLCRLQCVDAADLDVDGPKCDPFPGRLLPFLPAWLQCGFGKQQETAPTWPPLRFRSERPAWLHALHAARALMGLYARVVVLGLACRRRVSPFRLTLQVVPFPAGLAGARSHREAYHVDSKQSQAK